MLRLASADLPRRRLQARTEAGRYVQISLPRHQTLADGAVLLLESHFAIMVRVRKQALLRLLPRDAADALTLGYCAGNLHWTVRFEGPVLVVALDAPVAAYLARLGELADPGRLTIERVDTDSC